MKETLLLLDTSFTHLRVGLAGNCGVFDSVDKEAFMHQSEELAPTIDMLLKRNNLSKDDLGGVVVAKGPGSYTGVRIAMTSGKVIALALDIPLYLVSSLMILAHPKKRTAVIMDARAKRSYFAVYEDGKPLVEDAIWTNDEIMAYLEKNQGNIEVGGEPAHLGLKIDVPSIYVFENMVRGKEKSDTLSAKPAYLRGPIRV